MASLSPPVAMLSFSPVFPTVPVVRACLGFGWQTLTAEKELTGFDSQTCGYYQIIHSFYLTINFEPGGLS